MAPFRLRHPKGVSTIQLDTESATVQDLLQAIYTVSEIPPSAQDRSYYQRSRSPHSPLTLTRLFARSQSRIPTKGPHSGHTRAPALQSWPSARRSTYCRPKVWLCLGGAYIIIIIARESRPPSGRRPPYATIELEPKTGSSSSGAFDNN
jgi:hypothetical protein